MNVYPYIIKRELGDGSNAEQSLIQDEMTGKYFVVSSIDNAFGSETMIFQADENGSILSFSDVWVEYPNQHEAVLSLIESGELLIDEFYGVE